MSPGPTGRQADMLAHAVGSTDIEATHAPGDRRNNWYSTEEDPDALALVGLGLLRDAGPGMGGDGRYFKATDAGLAFVAESVAAARKRRGLRRFHVEMEHRGDTWSKAVMAKSRSAARWAAGDDCRDVGFSALESLRCVRSIRVAANTADERKGN